MDTKSDPMYKKRSYTPEKASEDIIRINITPNRMSNSNKQYKETKMREIMTAICALLNTEGGILLMHINDNQDRTTSVASVVRMIEQRVMGTIGNSMMVSNVKLEISDEEVVLSICKSHSIISLAYNLYLPTQTQVIAIPPTEPIEMVNKLVLNRKNIDNQVRMGTHKKKFVKDQNCGLQEADHVQFRNLKAAPSKSVTLADRMVSKSNKLLCYISAFANHEGGHIYFGIMDDGTVEGERVATENDINEITKKVDKAVNKMIWPAYLGRPQRTKNWDIFFEPVYDIDSAEIPSTYVIVLFVAFCPGGVFTEEPESYEVVEGEVQRMDFLKWKTKASGHHLIAISSNNRELPSHVKRCSWSSSKCEAICTKVSGHLQEFINNGNWQDFWRNAKKVEMIYPQHSEVKLVLLSKKVTAYYRTGKFSKAAAELDDYKRISLTSKDTLIFEVIGLYVAAALERSRGSLEVCRDILEVALQKAELIPPGLISAAVYLLSETVRGIIRAQERIPTGGMSSWVNEKPEVLSTKALEHLQNVQKFEEAKVDMEQKAHINLALIHLDCSLAGDIDTTKVVDKESLETATASLMAVNKIIICEGYALNHLRRIQFDFALSALNYRRSRLEEHQKQKHELLIAAFNLSKKAETLARECQFNEMVRYAQKYMAICTEDLVRNHYQCRSHWKASVTSPRPENNCS